MARPDREVSDLIQGLETLHKVFLGNTSVIGEHPFTVGPADRGDILRSSIAFIPQQDEAYYKVLPDVQPALVNLIKKGDPQLAQEILTQVGRIEAQKRQAYNWAPGNEGHHVAEMVGQNMAVATQTMDDALDALSRVDKTVPMGTQARSIVSLTDDEHFPIAHFDDELNAPNQHGISKIKVARDVLSKNPQGAGQVADLYTPLAKKEMEQSLKPLQMEEGKDVRNTAALLLGIDPSKLQDDSLAQPGRTNARRTMSQQYAIDLEKMLNNLGTSIAELSKATYGRTAEARSKSQGERALERKLTQRDQLETDGKVQFTRNNIDSTTAFSPVSKNSLANPGDMTRDQLIYQIRPGELAALRRLGLRL